MVFNIYIYIYVQFVIKDASDSDRIIYRLKFYRRYSETWVIN